MADGVAILTMDTSGSMSSIKKKTGLGYFNSLNNEGLKEHYIGFDKKGVEYNSAKELLETDTDGGTYVSSGIDLAFDTLNDLSIRQLRKSKIVIVTDGDNWCEDNYEVIYLIRKLILIGLEVHYIEVKKSTYSSTLMIKIQDELSEFFIKGKLKAERLEVGLN